MADDRPLSHVAIDGGAHLALAVDLARAGQSVLLLETDPHDRKRLQDYLRPVAGLVQLIEDPAVLCDADLVLGARGVSLDWQSATASLHISEGGPGARLIEVIGEVPQSHVRALTGALGATAVHLPAGTCPPSLRFQAALSVEMETLMLTGPTPEEIDAALEAAGFAIGPFEAQDAYGVDRALVDRRAVLARLGAVPELPLFARAVSEGRLGRRSGVGWYRYPGGGGKVEDPLIEDMAAEEAHFTGWPRRDVPASEIVSRVEAALAAVRTGILAEAVVGATDLALIERLALGRTC